MGGVVRMSHELPTPVRRVKCAADFKVLRALAHRVPAHLAVGKLALSGCNEARLKYGSLSTSIRTGEHHDGRGSLARAFELKVNPVDTAKIADREA